MPKKSSDDVIIMKSTYDPVLKKQHRPATKDPDAQMLIQTYNGKLKPYKPTQKQLKAAYYRAQGMSKMGAMRKAGYSKKHNSSAKVFSPQLETYLNNAMKDQLVKKGITVEKIAEKMAEWLDTQKTHVTRDGEVIVAGPDTANQMKAYDRINAIAGYSTERPRDLGSGTHRKISIEQWTFGEEYTDESEQSEEKEYHEEKESE